MKKITILLLSLCWLSANATIWRVNSNPQVNADFSSLQEAIDHWTVEEGDTLYLENGSFFGDNTFLSKTLTIIGPGYFLLENEQTYANPAPALVEKITITSDGSGSNLIGLTVINGVDISSNANDITIERSHLGQVGRTGFGSREGLTVKQCFIDGNIILTTYLESSYIHNNIITGRISLTSSSGSHNIYNNVFYHHDTSTNYIITARNSNVYNNVIIREPVDPNPSVNRTEYCIDFENTSNANSSFYRNIMSQSPSVLFPDNLYNQFKEDIFTLEGSSDKQWELKPGSPAIGYGTNGDDCGAYGGPEYYVPSGLPFMIPRIIEATIPSSGSGNVLPVHIKAKTQEE